MTERLVPIDPTLFDTSVSPSDDFYRYVNGGWLDTNPVPPEYGAWGAFHVVTVRNQTLLRELMEHASAEGSAVADDAARMAGDYYAAAMDEESIAQAGVGPLQPYLERIEAIADVADVRAVCCALQRIGVGALHSAGVAPDFEDADAYLVYLGQGGLGLPERDYYLRDDEQSLALRRAYSAHVAAQLKNLGSEDAEEAAERVVGLETRLAEASYTAERLRDVQLTMNRHLVADLDALMPAFGLSGYARDLGVTSESVNVDNPGFFTALEQLLDDTPVETLRDYLRWHLVQTYASALTPDFEKEAFEFYGRTLGGQQQMQPRWKRALGWASADIGEQIARLFVDAAFSEESKHRCEQMVDHLLSAMGTAIRKAEWMGEATRAEALEKLAGFSYKIGYPETWRDYSGLLIERGPHVANRIRAAAFEHDREMGRLGEPVDKAEWGMPAHTVNAYYHPLLNEIVFPAGILQPPFFYADADDAVNYGAIGAVIGHEITHGFDDRGSQFDAQGALRNWWADEDRAEFERRTQVVIEQFDAFEVAEGLHVNGRLTLGENIADLGGISIAYNALMETLSGDEPEIDGFTPAQRLFLSFATVWRTTVTEEYARLLVNVDPHSPAQFRVLGPLSNLPAFREAFGIAEGAPMARAGALQVHIW